jgi:hypothetical protein
MSNMTNFMERQRCIAELLEYTRMTLINRYCTNSTPGGFLEVDFFEENDGDMFFTVSYGTKAKLEERITNETWRINSETVMSNMSHSDKFARAEMESSDTTIREIKKEIVSPLFLVEVIFGDETFRYLETGFEEAKYRLRVCLEEKLDKNLIAELGENYTEDDLHSYCRDHSDHFFDIFGIFEITAGLQIVSREF